MCVSVFGCPLPRLLITSGMIWTPYDWSNKGYSFYMMVAVVVINDGHGIRIEHIVETNLIRVSDHYIS